MLEMTNKTLALALLILGLILASVGGAEAVMPISACGTLSVSASYQLTTNLSISSGDCLTVAADFVTIDLNGHEISGGGTAARGITDAGSARKEIAVRDGTIRGFVLGIALGSSTASLVDSVVLFDNGAVGGAGVSVGAGTTVKNSTMHDNIGNTVFVNGAGTVKDNVLVNNRGGGSSFVSLIRVGPRSVVRSNTLINNFGFDAAVIAAEDHSTVQDNVVNRNDAQANSIVGVSARSVVIHNTVLDNGGRGIEVNCPSTVKFNTALGNTGGNLVEHGSGCTNVGNNAP